MLKYLLRNHMIELDHWKIDKLVIYNQIPYLFFFKVGGKIFQYVEDAYSV
jgi:hypothetical protein